jgi:spermidine synthase
MLVGVLTVALLAVGARRRPPSGIALPWAVVTTGFAGMAADIVIILAFQTFFGHVYHSIGLLITAFMTGLAVGGILMNRNAAKLSSPRRVFSALEIGLIAFWAALPLALLGVQVGASRGTLLPLGQGALLGLNALAGFLVGSQFPLANTLCAGEGHQPTAAVFYASDLLGAFSGAAVVSVILVPALGVIETCVVVAALKLGSLAVFSLRGSGSNANG